MAPHRQRVRTPCVRFSACVFLTSRIFVIVARASLGKAVVQRRQHERPLRTPNRQLIFGRKWDSAQRTCRWGVVSLSGAAVAPRYDAAGTEDVAASKLHRCCSDEVIRIVLANGAKHLFSSRQNSCRTAFFACLFFLEGNSRHSFCRSSSRYL